MKRGNNNSNSRIIDADRPSCVDEEDASAGDEEQGLSTTVTHNDVITADQSSSPRIIGLEQVSGEGDAAAPIPLSQQVLQQFDDVVIKVKTEKSSLLLKEEELKEEQDWAAVLDGYSGFPYGYSGGQGSVGHGEESSDEDHYEEAVVEAAAGRERRQQQQQQQQHGHRVQPTSAAPATPPGYVPSLWPEREQAAARRAAEVG